MFDIDEPTPSNTDIIEKMKYHFYLIFDKLGELETKIHSLDRKIESLSSSTFPRT